MVVTVEGDLMAGGGHLARQAGVAVDHGPEHEEGGPPAPTVEGLEEGGRRPSVGPVVERQGDVVGSPAAGQAGQERPTDRADRREGRAAVPGGHGGGTRQSPAGPGPAPRMRHGLESGLAGSGL